MICWKRACQVYIDQLLTEANLHGSRATGQGDEVPEPALASVAAGSQQCKSV